MSAIGRSDDRLVEDFVLYVNETGFELRFPEDFPEELRSGELDGMSQWQIRRATSNHWIEQLVKQLHIHYPDLTAF
jgi:hypothetical protein